MRKLLAALAFALLPAAALAQGVPQFPKNLPANSVVGRISPVAGPSTAVPIATLKANILFGETPVSDAAYSATTSDATIAYTALTAARAVTLVSASSVSPGFRLTILDRSGSASTTFTISATPTGADLINGANATMVVVNSAYGGATLESDGISKWTLVLAGNAVLGPATADTIKCNPTSSAAVPQDCTVGATLTFSGSALRTVAMTGDVTTSANSFATTIGANKVTNSMLAQMAATSIKCNTTGSTANAADCTGAQVLTLTGAASLSTADQTLSGGANVTASSQGTKSSGTYTVDCGKSPLQFITNGGAFTLAAPSSDGSCMILSTNNASAGAITFSGFSDGANTGDTLDTTSTHKFSISIWRINGVSGHLVHAHQ